MSDETKKPTETPEDIIQDLDPITAGIELVETNSKKGTRYKYIRIHLDNGKQLRWFPFGQFDRDVVPTLQAALDESDK